MIPAASSARLDTDQGSSPDRRPSHRISGAKTRGQTPWSALSRPGVARGQPRHPSRCRRAVGFRNLSAFQEHDFQTVLACPTAMVRDPLGYSFSSRTPGRHRIPAACRFPPHSVGRGRSATQAWAPSGELDATEVLLFGACRFTVGAWLSTSAARAERRSRQAQTATGKGSMAHGPLFRRQGSTHRSSTTEADAANR